MLKQIHHILEEEKYECSIIKATGEFPYDHLLVFLGLDKNNRERILEITAQEQLLNLEEKPSAKSYYRVQFQHIFPFEVQELSLSQVAHLVLFLNQQVEFPGLELNELDNRVSYRYVWLTKASGVDSTLVISIVGIIRLLLEVFSDSLERLAHGKATFNELLEEIAELAKGTSKPKED